MTGVGFVPR